MTDLEGKKFDYYNDIINRLDFSNNFSIETLIEDALKERWNGTYYGTEYDFYPGIKINVNVEINFQHDLFSSVQSTKIDISDKNDVSKTTVNTLLGVWSTTKNSSIYIAKDNVTLVEFEGTIAHEFGHVLGLSDAYALNNNEYQPKSQNEIRYDFDYKNLPEAGDIMFYSGHASSNTIEMVLTAFEENQYQYYVPFHNVLFTRSISSSIKESQLYKHQTDNNGILSFDEFDYIWDDVSNQFVVAN